MGVAGTKAKQASLRTQCLALQIDDARQLNQERPGGWGWVGLADWTGLGWTGRWLNSRCVREVATRLSSNCRLERQWQKKNDK